MGKSFRSDKNRAYNKKEVKREMISPIATVNDSVALGEVFFRYMFPDTGIVENTMLSIGTSPDIDISLIINIKHPLERTERREVWDVKPGLNEISAIRFEKGEMISLSFEPKDESAEVLEGIITDVWLSAKIILR